MISAGDAIEWRKSTRCGNSTCVEVSRAGEAYLVRDGKDPQGPVLRFTDEEWAAFVAGVVAGEFRFE